VDIRSTYLVQLVDQLDRDQLDREGSTALESPTPQVVQLQLDRLQLDRSSSPALLQLDRLQLERV
jgi:hypothetical protein